MKTRRHISPLIRGVLAFGMAAWLASDARGRVLDNFDDNASTGWTPFTFAPGAGSMVEQNGQYRFELPAFVLQAFGGALFCASTKTSEQYTLQEGRTIEFRVDVKQGGGTDSFAVLGFLPTTSGGPGQLKGYSLAKSTTDALIVKGINKYFVDNNTSEGAPGKQDNVTLVLRMSAKGGTVTITGQILDKDANDAVLWERTVRDTPVADPMDEGTDDPAGPFLGAGNFVLYLYADYDEAAPEDPYRAFFDNAEVFVTDAQVIDDFNDNTKTGWADFTFQPGVGIMQEQNGQLRMDLPGAVMAQVRQGIFCASTKTSPLVEVKEGERLEFQVDVMDGGLKDSFAILAFIPTSSGGPQQLKGYSFAKSITDVLIVKGLGQYFVADDEVTAEIKQQNVTMVLSMTTQNGVVTIDAKVLDKDDNNAVVWHRVVKDTPGADIMAEGTDNPAAPYIGTGNFVLMLFADYDAGAPEDPYFVVFDNAVIAAPPQEGNTPAIITDLLPNDRANFLSAPAQISFKVTDDKPLVNEKISVEVNGTTITTANGLTIQGSGTSVTGTLGGLGADTNYVAVVRVEDTNGEVTTKKVNFDTFRTDRMLLEIENYNFSGGQFIDNVKLTAEGWYDPESYNWAVGVEGVDYSDTRPGPAGGEENPYRPDDKVRMAWTRDSVRANYAAAGGAQAEVHDYDVGDIAAGEWLNYTKTFPAGAYEVYLRQAVYNLTTAETVLEKVVSDPAQPDQVTQLLGSFLGTESGFVYGNTPLTDASGTQKAVLRLNGVTTLRLRQVTGDTSDGGRLQTYMIFIPVPDPGPQRAVVSAVSPASGSTVDTVSPEVTATILNRDTTVTVNTIQLQLNGQTVPAVVTSTATGASLRYVVQPLPASGSKVTAQVTFRDSDNVEVNTSWEFTLTYRSLDPALRVTGTGETRGFNVRVVQAQPGLNTANSLEFAESILRPNPALALQYDTNVTSQVVNYSQNGPGSADGSFPDDELIPGMDPFVGSDDIAMEATAYLELPAGKYRFGANCDDGYKVQVVPSFTARDTAALAFHNGGPANETFDFVVSEGGLYRFRFVWYERGGGAHVEFFQGNFTNADRLLINAAGTVKAFTTISAPLAFTGATLNNGQLTITWSGTGTLEESGNLANWTTVPGNPSGTYTTPVGTTPGGKYYRLKQ